MIPYPSNYFDPYGDEPRAQCTECGDWFEDGEIEDVQEVPDIIGSVYQGVCRNCKKEN